MQRGSPRARGPNRAATKFITPALREAGWDIVTQIREEVRFTKGRIIVRGKLVTRGKAKRADYILYYKPNIPIAIVETKDNNCAMGDGMQQGLEYAATLNIPFVFSSNGDGFVFHDRTGTSAAASRSDAACSVASRGPTARRTSDHSATRGREEVTSGRACVQTGRGTCFRECYRARQSAPPMARETPRPRLRRCAPGKARRRAAGA
jgi:type I restriction enzyme R subunit